MNPVQRVVQTGLLKAYGAVSRTGVVWLVAHLYEKALDTANGSKVL